MKLLKRILDNLGIKINTTYNPLYCFYKNSFFDFWFIFTWTGIKLAKVLTPRRKVRVGDVVFNLSCDSIITYLRWVLFERKEPEVRNFIDQYLKDGDTFFDIGANVGVFSLYAAKKYKDISLYCFEPEYSNLHLLKENIIFNDLTRQTKIFSSAVGDNVGLSTLHLQDTKPGAAAHTESKTKILKTDEGYDVVLAEGIFTVTLDYICEELGVVPNGIKIDTDGAEDRVLKGAQKVLADLQLRFIIMEMTGDKVKDEFCCLALKKAGFVLGWSDRKITKNEVWIRKSSND